MSIRQLTQVADVGPGFSSEPVYSPGPLAPPPPMYVPAQVVEQAPAGPGFTAVDAQVVDYAPPPRASIAAVKAQIEETAIPVGPGITAVSAQVIDRAPPAPTIMPVSAQVNTTAGPGFTSEAPPVSILSNLVKNVAGVAKVAGGFLAGGPAGGIAAAASLAGSRAAIPAAGSAILPGIGRAVGAIAPYVGGAVASGIGSFVGSAVATTGCGCNGSSGRDPCTHQRLSSQRAPEATLFGGCCPPGRTLRRRPWARDICIKTPKMNVFNPSALARADRRVTGFARRAAPMLKDLGFQVSRNRRPKLGGKKRRRRAA